MRQAASNCGVGAETVQPFIDKLADKWIHTLDDMKEMSDEEWKQVGVDKKPLLK